MEGNWNDIPNPAEATAANCEDVTEEGIAIVTCPTEATIIKEKRTDTKKPDTLIVSGCRL